MLFFSSTLEIVPSMKLALAKEKSVEVILKFLASSFDSNDFASILTLALFKKVDKLSDFFILKSILLNVPETPTFEASLKPVHLTFKSRSYKPIKFYK